MSDSKKEFGKRVLAIDPSMRHIGVCFFDDRVLSHQDCLIYKKNLKNGKLLKKIYQDILSILQRFKPDVVGIEGYSYMSVGKVYQLGEVGGVIRLACSILNIPVIVIPPSRIKKFAGKGNADKEYMVSYVLKHEEKADKQLISKYNDVADAIVLGILIILGFEYARSKKLPQTRKAAEVVVSIQPTINSIIEGLHEQVFS